MDKILATLYNQNNYPDLLGNSTTETIAMGGCFVSSGCMVAEYFGITITPSEINKLLIQKDIYVQGDLLTDNWLSLLYPSIKYVKTLDFEPIPTDLHLISQYLHDPSIMLIARINLGGGNLHFVVPVACDGVATLHIANPLSGKIEDFSQWYGNPITANLHILIYQGTAPTVSNVVIPQNPPSSTLAVSFAQAVTKANNFDALADYFGMSSTDRVTTTAGQTLVQKIQFLQQEAEDLQGKLNAQALTTAVPASVIQTVTTTTTSPQNGVKFQSGTPAVSISTPPLVPGIANSKTSQAVGKNSTGLAIFLKALFKTLFL